MNVFVEVREGLRISWAAIRSNKLRSGLTTLGIVIGILTVSLMATAIQGLNQSFMQSISALGTDVFYLEKFPWERVDDWWKLHNRRDFSINYARTISRESKTALAISVEASWNHPVKYKDRSAAGVWVVGNNEQSAIVRGLTVREGRFLSESDVEGARPVCVLGAEIAERFFENESPLGKKMRINGYNYEVVGVLEKFGKFLFANMDAQIIVPISRFVTETSRRPYVFLMVKVRDPKQMDEAREELRGIMRKIRRIPPGGEDDFCINQQEQLVKTFHRVGGTIASAGLFITGLSLFVGGIGIMNIMFVSVAERTKEIGVRKAIGARRRTILIQFLIEAAIVCLFGGLLAVGIAWPICLLMKQWLPASLSLEVVGLALLISLLTGLVSGFLPAWRAARMNPVDALRSE
jgi:putative ABC transport system permease protein